MKKIISILFTCFLFASSFGQLDRSVTPKAGPAAVINIPDPVIFTLDNGVTVILSENHKTPRFSFNLVMGSDPMLEKDKTGLSDLAGQLVLSGTNSMDKDALDKAIDMMGVSFSADGNSIYASGLSKYRKGMLDILTDVVKNANFPQAEFDRIVKQTESSLAMTQSEADQMADNVLSTVDFGRNHPYGEVMTSASLANITRDDVVSYFKREFTPKGAYLVVVGDVTKDDITQLLQGSIASWTGGDKYAASYTVSNTNVGPRVIFVKKPGAVQSVIKVTFPVSIKPGDADEIGLKMMNQILGGGTFEAKLMQNLREDKAYTYGCYSSVDVDRYGSYYTTKGSFRNEVTDSAIVQILKEIESMKTDAGVTQAQLDLAKASTNGSFSRSLESPQTIARFALNTIQNNLDKDYYKNYLKKVEGVTLADIKNMATKYLATDKAFIIVVGSEDIAEKLKQFDGDGKIEFLDAFGNPEVGFKKSDLTLEQVFDKNVLATTQSKTIKEAQKKMSKIKKVTQKIAAQPAGAPVTLDILMYFEAPNKEAMEVQFNGSMMQRTFFNGTAGGSESSPMAGGKSTELSAEEIADKNKTAGLIPEMTYISNKADVELLGIKEDGKNKYYVVEVKSSEGTTQNFYDATTFLKVKTYSTEKGEDGELQEATIEYMDFKDVSGILFPHKMKQQFGKMALSSEVKNIEVNKTIDAKMFVK